MGRARISLCMILKNEEASLPTCLASAVDLVDEVIVVDTGSTDRTREVAQRFGACVYPFVWIDDFSAARNESLRHASGDWIFWLDGDEWLDEANQHCLRELFASLGDGNAAYVMTQRCLNQSSLAGPLTRTTMDVEQVRLFRRLPEIRWQNRVYEQVHDSVRRLGWTLCHTAAVIQHLGYQDPVVHRGKIERNLRLARLDLAERPDDTYVLYTIGIFEQLLGNFAESLPVLERSRDQLRPGSTFGPKLYALLVQAYRRLSQGEKAGMACRIARSLYPQDPELFLQEGLLLQEAGDLRGAENYFLNLLEERPEGFAIRLGPELREQVQVMLQEVRNCRQERDVKALLRQARANFDRQDFTAAREVLELAIARAPHALEPRLALSHVLMREGRDWDAFERALRDVLSIDPGHAETRHNLVVLMKRRPLGYPSES